MIALCCSHAPCQRQTLKIQAPEGGFAAKVFIIWDDYTTQDAKPDKTFRYATLEFRRGRALTGRSFSCAVVLATDDPKKDWSIYRRALTYMKRCKGDWQIFDWGHPCGINYTWQMMMDTFGLSGTGRYFRIGDDPIAAGLCD